MRNSNLKAIGAAALAVAIGAAGAVGSEARPQAGAGLPQGNEQVVLDPADFSTTIDNRYWPMKPGTRWLYRETARVVRDTVTEDGRLVEDTSDWYAPADPPRRLGI